MITTKQISHLDTIESFLAMEIFSKAKELEDKGKEIIHMELGEPDFPAPDEALLSIQKSMKKNNAGYTCAKGLYALRKEIANKYALDYGVDISPEQILVSNGTSILLYLSILLIAPIDSEVIVTDPCYSCYEKVIRLAGAKPVFVKLNKEKGFQLDIDDIKKKITKKTRAFLINSPMNPTGVVFSSELMKRFSEFDIPVISDEVYADLSYEKPPRSYLSFSKKAIAINGFSKYYAMTGWRLGYVITPKEWMPAMERLHQNLMISATQFVQEAGIEVLKNSNEYCQKMKSEFNARRLFMLDYLRDLGMDQVYNPTGAFYIMYKYKDTTKKSLDFCLEVLEKTGVAITPGRDFGSGGEGYIRLSYAQSKEKIELALKRLFESKFI